MRTALTAKNFLKAMNEFRFFQYTLPTDGNIKRTLSRFGNAQDIGAPVLDAPKPSAFHERAAKNRPTCDI